MSPDRVIHESVLKRARRYVDPHAHEYGEFVLPLSQPEGTLSARQLVRRALARNATERYKASDSEGAMADWGRELRALLAEHPGLTVHQIRAQLRANGTEPPTKSALNAILYRHALAFRHEGPRGVLPRWYVVDDGAAVAATPSAPLIKPSAPPHSLALYPWQQRALDAWAAAGYRGVIEAVTGAGKTRVAMAAIATQLTSGGRVAVLVHTRELVDQWVDEIVRLVPAAMGRRVAIGRLGGGYHQTLAEVEVLIATAQSAAGWQLGLGSKSGLLIADEVHHYGASAWSKGLEPGFDRRLGLTATYEREDRASNGISTHTSAACGTPWSTKRRFVKASLRRSRLPLSAPGLSQPRQRRTPIYPTNYAVASRGS